MSSQSKNKDFASLQAEWTKKLEKSGFVDIEQPDGRLKTHATTRLRATTQIRYESNEQYFRLAGFFYYDHEFVNHKEKQIWFLHSNGVPIRESVRRLRKQGYRADKTSVHETIQELVKLMYERYR